tara:strand:+ start:4 stop:282 length:279 start_codon:yes stop_codon:yes gene_type:complete
MEEINSTKEAQKILTENEVWYNFLRIPSKLAEELPKNDTRLKFIIDGKETSLLYLAKYKKVCGMTFWYRKYGVKKGHVLKIRNTKKGYKIII